MTELEKIMRAKSYVDSLANGINPIDGTVVPDGDLINNVRLSRCFFFISDVLRQVIENGGLEPVKVEKKAKKLLFDLPLEKRAQFNYSEKPIPISEIANRINALIDIENMKKLSYSSIRAWLIDVGMLEFVPTLDGKSTKRPTAFGRENGISMEERIGSKGPYEVVVYNKSAQHFILDNLDSIVFGK